MNQTLGRTVTDTIVLEGQFSFTPDTSFKTAAEVIVATARALYGTMLRTSRSRRSRTAASYSERSEGGAGSISGPLHVFGVSEKRAARSRALRAGV
jgi:hypothetical protein